MTPQFKPYQMVYVTEEGDCEGGTFYYIGEVISMPLPDGNIMVRRVPAHPGTAQEMPMTKLTALQPHQKAKWVHYARVRGSGQFPVDMLRYDSAVPLNFSLEPHAFHRTRSVPVIIPSFGFDDLIVCNVTKSRTDSGWTPERWRSFLWTCTPLKAEPIGGYA
jgi:hypothetical protein